MASPPVPPNGPLSRSVGSLNNSASTDQSGTRSVQLPPVSRTTMPNGAPVNAFATSSAPVQEVAVGSAASEASLASSSDDDDTAPAERKGVDDAASSGEDMACTAAPASVQGSVCAICFERPWDVAIGECSHQLCMQCAQGICYKSPRLPSCPFCRTQIKTFVRGGQHGACE